MVHGSLAEKQVTDELRFNKLLTYGDGRIPGLVFVRTQQGKQNEKEVYVTISWGDYPLALSLPLELP